MRERGTFGESKMTRRQRDDMQPLPGHVHLISLVVRRGGTFEGEQDDAAARVVLEGGEHRLLTHTHTHEHGDSQPRAAQARVQGGAGREGG